MRRVLAAFLVFAALAAGLIVGAYAAVLPQGDQAVFTVRTLAGDPAAAEGLELSPVRICDRYLVWDAAFPAAAPEQAGLSWNFYWCQYTEGHIAPRWLPLSIELDGGYAEPDRTHNNPLAQAVLDALSRGDTSAYRTDTDNFLTLRMADYADTLPFEVDADTFTIGESQVVPSDSEVTDLFRAYFSIPTPDGLQMEITLHAAQDGTIPFLSFEPDDALTLSSPSLSNGSGLYFTLCAQGELARELDPSQIPGGWGLYRFDGTDIETVWSLPEGERPANFWSDGEGFFFLFPGPGGRLPLPAGPGDLHPGGAADPLPPGRRRPQSGLLSGRGGGLPGRGLHRPPGPAHPGERGLESGLYRRHLRPGGSGLPPLRLYGHGGRVVRLPGLGL